MGLAALRPCQVKDLRKNSLSKNKPASGGNFQDSLLKLVRTLPKAPVLVMNWGFTGEVFFFVIPPIFFGIDMDT